MIPLMRFGREDFVRGMEDKKKPIVLPSIRGFGGFASPPPRGDGHQQQQQGGRGGGEATVTTTAGDVGRWRWLDVVAPNIW